MKWFQAGMLGIALLIGALGCGMLSDSASNPTPTTVILVVPTVPPPPPPTLPPPLPTVPGAQVVTVTESDLNQQLNQNLPPDGQVSNVFLDLHPGNTGNVSATLRLNSLTLQPNASLQVAVVNHRIAIDVTQVRVGGFGVPSSMIEPQVANLKSLAERELNSQLASVEANTGFKLQSISTTETGMSLTFAP